ncbi:hypothetical protein ACQ4PT_052883 [Festuca glaucescens]
MAEGVSSDCEIVPTGDGRTFHFRVRLSSLRPGQDLGSRTVDLAGCSCTAGCWPRSSSPSIVFLLALHSNPALEAASKVSTHMVLLDKTGSPASSVGTGKIRKTSCSGYMDGCYGLVARTSAVRANCVVDNYVVVLCSVDIDWTPPASSIKDLGHDLAMMLDKQDLTDVTFDVGGESISAHRLVLAARSPVFKAELYGPMAESKMTSITIQDMEASTFRSMLHYMYHGSLPHAGNAHVSSTLAEYQHLLVAADKIVGTSGEYLQVMQTFPTLLVEARNRLKIPHGEPAIMETPAPSVEEQLLDLGHELAMMFDNQDLTDVSFDVGGESFSAHRLVLAARSPVFKAELYGPMAESIITSITIQDMEASTFRSMLHYMYHGSLSNADRNDVSSTMAQYQHLLVAADRYGLQRLKKNCEDSLCASGIVIDSVVSLLELAEDHACLKLKTECLDFLANVENFKMVATSAEYLRLMQSFPSLLVEMRNRFKMVHKEPTTMNPCAQKKSRVR